MSIRTNIVCGQKLKSFDPSFFMSIFLNLHVEVKISIIHLIENPLI